MRGDKRGFRRNKRREAAVDTRPLLIVAQLEASGSLVRAAFGLQDDDGLKIAFALAVCVLH
jgi:hypothetical protein